MDKKKSVKCSVQYTEDTNDNGIEQPKVVVQCSNCGHSEESWGHGPRSVARSCWMLSQNCPQGRTDHFYKIPEEDDSAALASYHGDGLSDELPF